MNTPGTLAGKMETIRKARDSLLLTSISLFRTQAKLQGSLCSAQNGRTRRKNGLQLACVLYNK
jgi:hypothetical protein